MDGLGTLENQGTVTVEEPLQLRGNVVHSAGAILQGSGTLDITGATATFAGDIEPGASGTPGVLTIAGNLVLQGTSNINLDIDDYALGTGYDRLVISGSLTLDGCGSGSCGTLNLLRDPLFVPDEGSIFSVITYSSHTGAFATETGTAPFNGGTRQFVTSANATSFDVETVIP
jgi:hypothetical protein